MKTIRIMAIGFALLLIMAVILSCTPDANKPDSSGEPTSGSEDNSPESTTQESSEGTTQTSSEHTSSQASEPVIDYSVKNLTLSGLLPQKKGFKWRYFGFAEYGHEMTLDSIIKKNGSTTYTISGMIDDMSGGEAGNDYSMALEYVITEGKLIQNSINGKNMDSQFKNLILLQTPLEKGSTWTQKAVNKDNVEVELECTIKDVKENGYKTYVVRYVQKDGDYFEEREIREDSGIVSFTMPFVSGADRFEIGFSLYDEMSGYAEERELKLLLPPQNKTLRYFGLAEYGHIAKLDKTIIKPGQVIYEVNGNFQDGSGIPGNFKVQYILDRDNFTIYTVKYTVEDIPGYFDNTYIQERRFQTGRGMTAFSQLMPGDIGISGKDLDDKQKVENAIINHMFGYSLDVSNW
jgi:hypothetical protein